MLLDIITRFQTFSFNLISSFCYQVPFPLSPFLTQDIFLNSLQNMHYVILLNNVLLLSVLNYRTTFKYVIPYSGGSQFIFCIKILKRKLFLCLFLGLINCNPVS